VLGISDRGEKLDRNRRGFDELPDPDGVCARAIGYENMLQAEPGKTPFRPNQRPRHD